MNNSLETVGKSVFALIESTMSETDPAKIASMNSVMHDLFEPVARSSQAITEYLDVIYTGPNKINHLHTDLVSKGTVFMLTFYRNPAWAKIVWPNSVNKLVFVKFTRPKYYYLVPQVVENKPKNKTLVLKDEWGSE